MRRTDWIIAGFLAVLFLFVLGGLMIFWLQSQAYVNLPNSAVAGSSGSAEFGADNSPSGVGITAKTAGSAADAAAVQWQPDAQLVSMAAYIVQFEQIDDIYGGRTDWTIVYYSPGSGTVATYTASEGVVSFLNSKKLETVPPLFNIDDAKLDSGQAMTAAVTSGGLAILQDGTERVASLKLDVNPQTGRLEWQILIQNETTGAFQATRIDAQTGEIIEQVGL